MRVVVCYDISEDATREKVAASLQDLLTRVQYSVFEGEPPPEALDARVKSALGLINPDTDSLRVYWLCAACAGRADTYGRQVEVTPPAVRVL